MSDVVLRVGSILGRSFGILGKNFAPFMVLAFLLYLPSIYIAYDLVEEIKAGHFEEGAELPLRIVSGLAAQLLTATLTYGTVMELKGAHAGLASAIRVGLVRAIPCVIVAILMALAIGVGLILLIVPGVIIMTILYVAIPVAVIEKPGIFASLRRSGELTKYHRMKIFALALLLGGSSVIINMILQKSIFDPLDITTFSTYVYATIGVEILFAVLGAIVAAVTYHDLRKLKEGVSIDELAAVFD